jgi:VWFA-related protein
MPTSILEPATSSRLTKEVEPRHNGWQFRVAALALILLACLAGIAQQITLHGGTSVVLVPTLVTNNAGEPVFRLSADDFSIYDNGVEQKVHLDEILQGAQTSVVVAVQKGHAADATLDKVRRLGSLLYPIVGDGKGEVAVVAFDDKPELKQDFTTNLDQTTKALKQIAPGSYGCAVLDAIAYSIGMLDSRAPANRKVLFLVSSANDDGSRASTPEVIRQIERSNILIYSAAYSQTAASKLGETLADPSDHPVNLLGIFSSLLRSAKENVPKTVAEMSGGEYLPFHDEKTLEQELAGVNNHYFNQYLLSFTPKKLSLGQHTLRVVVDRGDVVVTARSGYWVGEISPKDEPATSSNPAGTSR